MGTVMYALLDAYPEGMFRLSHWTDVDGNDHWWAGHEVGHRLGRRTFYDRTNAEGPTPVAALRALLVEARP
jgi:hypothetical protein